MVGFFIFKDREGQTPLPPELKKGLKKITVQTIGELDEYEEQNIAEGLIWLNRCTEDCTSYNFWLKLHKKCSGMYGIGLAKFERTNYITRIF